MLPSSRCQSAATTALAGGTCELFRVKRLREIPESRVVDFGALSTPLLASGGGADSPGLCFLGPPLPSPSVGSGVPVEARLGFGSKDILLFLSE